MRNILLLPYKKLFNLQAYILYIVNILNYLNKETPTILKEVINNAISVQIATSLTDFLLIYFHLLLMKISYK